MGPFVSAAKKPESGTAARVSTPSDGRRAHALVTVPRTWLVVLTAFVIVPWLMVAAWSLAPGRPAVAPAAQDQPESDLPAGPWGRLITAPLVISPPLEYVAADWGGWPEGAVQWNFPGVSREELEAFLVTAGMPRDQIATVLSSARSDAATQGLVVTPSAELRRSLPPEVRARLYLQLAKSTRNVEQESAFRFFGDSPDAWLKGSLMSPESRRLIEPLIYRDGSALRFSDVDLIRSRIQDPAELQRIAKTLLRQSTMLVKLTVSSPADVGPLVDYWGRGGRRTDIRPLLESLAEAGPSQPIDIVHLLPAIVRNHLYRYPRITTADLDRPVLANCLWTALNFFRLEPDDRYLDVNIAIDTLRRDYFVVESGFQLGDVIALLDEQGTLFHVVVYLADDLVFTKNGTSPMAPWIIAPLDQVKAFYHTRSASPRLIYHRRNDL